MDSGKNNRRAGESQNPKFETLIDGLQK